MKILFVCHMAALRSATAYEILKERAIVDYCGTSSDAIKKPTLSMLESADKIVIFGSDNRDRLRRKFKGFSHKMRVWDIPDEFAFMDDDLVFEIKRRHKAMIANN